jgi:hypothetical protein
MLADTRAGAHLAESGALDLDEIAVAKILDPSGGGNLAQSLAPAFHLG